MKCPRCKFYNICKGRLNETVENCVRFKSVEQTNEEYLRSLNTEQLAEWISKVTIDAWFRQVNNELPKPNGAKEWAEWLKQLHKE